MHHPCKKAYFNAFMTAYYDWDPVMLEQAKEALRALREQQEEMVSSIGRVQQALHSRLVLSHWQRIVRRT